MWAFAYLMGFDMRRGLSRKQQKPYPTQTGFWDGRNADGTQCAALRRFRLADVFRSTQLMSVILSSEGENQSGLCCTRPLLAPFLPPLSLARSV